MRRTFILTLALLVSGLVLLPSFRAAADPPVRQQREIEKQDRQTQCIAEATGFAETNGFDASYIEKLPPMRLAALKKAIPTGEDSSADCINKEEDYYSTLKCMIQTLRSKYYFHQGFPTDLCSALEQHAVVLTGVQYPLAATEGCSAYSAILADNKIGLAEHLIDRMVCAIYEGACWDDAPPWPSKHGMKLYHSWLKKWNAKKIVHLREQVVKYCPDA